MLEVSARIIVLYVLVERDTIVRYNVNIDSNKELKFFIEKVDVDDYFLLTKTAKTITTHHRIYANPSHEEETRALR